MNITDLTPAMDMIKTFEGCSLKAYKCPAGRWTISYGHTAGVREGDVITQEQAELMLQEDVQQYAQELQRLLKDEGVEVNINQFNALLDFVYNLGVSALKKSTLLKKLKAGDYAGACEEFGKWNKAGGKELAGLTRRRAAEQRLFRSAVVEAS